MYDRFNREINYLRISVTDKCNLRCVYCMPSEGVPKKKHKDFLSFEEITEVVREGAALGLRKVRLTGGEPLVKRGIADLVSMISSVKGVEHLAMTTNGVVLEGLAPDLRAAGLDSLNISLDTLSPERYNRITRVGDITPVLRGLDAAAAAGFPIKINTVITDDTSAEELEALRQYCFSRGFRIQFINHFSICGEKRDDYRFDRPPACRDCNRIRLLAEGILKPCLHSDDEIVLDKNDIRGCLIETIRRKPEHGGVCGSRDMHEIGG